MAFVGHKLLGVRVTRTTTDQEHELGMVVHGDDGQRWRYVLAAEALPAYKPVDYTAAFSASVTDAGDICMGVPQVAIASGSYGWILEKGFGTVMVTASLASGSTLGYHTTAGGLANAAVETKAGDGCRGITYAEEAGTPAGVSTLLF